MTLEGPDQRRLLRGPPTRNLEAYQLYLEARADLWSARASYAAAFDKLQLALRLDPAFAAGAGEHRVRAVGGARFRRSAARDAGGRGTRGPAGAGQRAGLGATHRALAIIRAAQARWLEAEVSVQQALALDDTDPMTWLYTRRTCSVRWATCMQGCRVRARRTASHPRIPLSTSSCVADHMLNGNDDEARTHAQAAFDLGMARTVAPLVMCCPNPNSVRAAMTLRAH